MTRFVSLPLAESRLDSLTEGFRNHGGVGRDEVLLGLLMVAALVAGVWAVTRLLGLRRRPRGYNNPWQLFWALCKAHKLNWSDSWLLRRVARHLKLRDPGRLFLEVEHWEEKNLGATFSLEFVRLRLLRNQLLGPITASPTHPPAAPRQPTPVASPLFHRVAAPTLDVPPWTESHSVQT